MLFNFNGETGMIDSPHVLRFIAGLIFNRPLMIEQTELDFIMYMLAPRLGIDPPGIEGRLRTTKVERTIPGSSRIATTAVIPIHGALVNRRMGSAASGGPTTYAEIREAFKSAMEDKDVSRTLLHIDTGGGDVSGAFDTAEMIFKARGQKPIDAFVDESAYSAGYLLASAADRIYVPQTGGVGSIGVIAMFRNQKAKNMKEGVEYEAIKFGEAKADFSPHEPLSDRARATLRAQVNDIGNMFVDVVARNRKVDREKILGTQAEIFRGKSAREIGLVDDFMSFEDAVGLDYGRQEEVFSMAAEEQILSMLQNISTRITSLEEGKGAPRVEVVTTPEQQATDYRYDILNACLAVSGLLGGARKAQELATALNKEGVSLAEAHNRIIARVAESQSKEEIRTTVGADGYGDINPLDAACDRLIASLPKRQGM